MFCMLNFFFLSIMFTLFLDTDNVYFSVKQNLTGSSLGVCQIRNKVSVQPYET